MTWQCPKQLPDLSRYEYLSLDIETRDPYLKDKGPGCFRGDSYTVGIAVGAPDGQRWYIPFRHAEGQQYDREEVLRWARVELCRPMQPKVFANAQYDLNQLYAEGVQVAGPFWDVQNAEPILDENRKHYNLDSLAEQYLGEGKDEALMQMACDARGLKGKPQQHLWCLPPEYVGPYAEADVDRTLRVWDAQRALLHKEGLWGLFDLETRLVPLLLAMRRRGVRVAIDRVRQARHDLQRKLDLAKRRLRELAGREVEYWANEDIAKACDDLGIEYPRTKATGMPSFRSYWLERTNHAFAQAVVECRKLDKLIGTFLEGAILDCAVGERLHCELHQLRGDDFGTVTGRFSSSRPNLQQIPKGSGVVGDLIRSFFIPEKGELWGRADLAQIELRLLAHYASGDGAEMIRQKYAEDPTIDFHQTCADFIKVDRSVSKSINFSIVYGAGKKKLAMQLGLPLEEAEPLMKRYHDTFPFLKNTTRLAMRAAQDRGYVHTVLGRRRRFDRWEPRDWDLSQRFRKECDSPTDPREVHAWITEQIKKARAAGGPVPRGGVQRAFAYKALNAVIQGSAADLLKKAMVDIWDSGVCDVLGVPLLSVHDELDFSVPNTERGRQAFREMAHLMETAIPFRVPILADAELKVNWGTKLEEQ